MKTYQATASIRGTPDQVWAVLTDVPSYPDWDPFCERIEGGVVPGGRLKVYSKLSPGRAFPVRVTELDTARRMTWTGGMPLGLFKGVRTFTLAADGNGHTDFGLREVFSGPMLRLIGGSIPDMTEAFAAFAAGLKSRVEGAA